jgi:hypothetical protein
MGGLNFGQDSNGPAFWNLIKCKSSWQPGDLLYVRETWRGIEQDFGPDRIEYKATETINLKDKWRPSIHMPKEAARIWLQVTDVRVERLMDISIADAKAEGVEIITGGTFPYRHYGSSTASCSNAIASFESLWREINGDESWDTNPWVWAINFKVLSTTGKPVISLTENVQR